jgi:signal transduction histidine kinase
MEQAKLGRGITEVSLKRGADDTVPVGVALSPVPLGNAPTMCAVVTDLTEQRQHEELRRAQAALKDADRRKDEFLATLAHELRNPLAPVSSAVHILRLKAPAIPEVQWAQEVIERQVEQMTRLVDDLLDLSRVTRNQIILRRAPVELATIIRSAVETSTPAIDLAGHRLNVEVPPSAVILDVDQMRISQVLANLLNNAAKYTNRGGTITVRAGMHGDHVVIDVEDTGVGIPQELLPRVFDMFTQVDRSLERTQTGLGIGLTLSKRLMEMHGGTIVVRSEPGKGSTFTVRLPRRTGPEREARGRNRRQQPACPHRGRQRGQRGQFVPGAADPRPSRSRGVRRCLGAAGRRQLSPGRHPARPGHAGSRRT